MKLEPKVLENRFVRLEPLAEGHKEELRAACAADPALWRDLYILSMLDDHFDRHWDRMQAEAVAGKTFPHAVLVGGVCLGMSNYLDVDQHHNAVEIGSTYYDPRMRGREVNPSAKRLLLAHAFESGAERVQFRVDATNARSRAAVLKLGAVQEGILRHDKVTWTGRIRDTVHFSILAGEWPAVRDRLDARIATFAT
ncbi:MAG: GNAT family N-acetyltransferase [Alphaproteobacteria bacterium]|nr:GNAT family N-acetyltransferase [Alphaproteobacteria bacterium]MBU1512530.1 GNAT family N-acetyltransferase [Alphaproteobacteria bacterium]MBU2092869.1 GNAT family N-acetyltransferase [Alphaproteobacteria bacterium]MBU2150892.1 GNAT family N-acetyltransferase [Alphaproteobacteria bacterium]MBU2307897.1 GNAT family N-acetyltransferase [Alphaproteobacteria bacterium]